MRTTDARAVLGVNSSATYTEIKRAWRERAKVLHPDRNPSKHAIRDFATLQEAFKLLMNFRSQFQQDRYKKKNYKRFALVLQRRKHGLQQPAEEGRRGRESS